MRPKELIDSGFIELSSVAATCRTDGTEACVNICSLRANSDESKQQRHNNSTRVALP
jgi:hypothetical protein